MAANEHAEMCISVDALEPELQQPGASFVTLQMNGDLRGCIGSLNPAVRWGWMSSPMLTLHAGVIRVFRRRRTGTAVYIC